MNAVAEECLANTCTNKVQDNRILTLENNYANIEKKLDDTTKDGKEALKLLMQISGKLNVAH